MKVLGLVLALGAICTATSLAAAPPHRAKHQSAALANKPVPVAAPEPPGPPPGSQFNLQCTGTMRTIVPALLKNETEQYSYVYRVDLNTKKWCSGDCKTQFDFASITPIALVLEDRDVDTPRNRDKTHSEISRETGDQHISSDSVSDGISMGMFWTGHCEKGPFTGFPSVETKF